MTAAELGHPTLHSRVERWECDFNDHWNARFYARSFQQAADVLAFQANGQIADGLSVETRHIRYHRELFVGAPVEVRSAWVPKGAFSGALLHLLCSNGQIAATALDRPRFDIAGLPPVTLDEMPQAKPRGLTDASVVAWDRDAPDAVVTETGPIRPADLDHCGQPLYEAIFRNVSISATHHLDRLGLTPDYMKQANITRMAVEARISRVGDWTLGMPLLVKSRLTSVGAKAFATAHRIETADGQLAALFENNVVTVDLATRRARHVPDVLSRFEAI